jgi:hypothetical protein
MRLVRTRATCEIESGLHADFGARLAPDFLAINAAACAAGMALPK